MLSQVFPDPLTYRYPEWVTIGNYLYRSHDVISFGTPLNVDTLKEAYLKGIFPWNTEGIPLPWHCPEIRAILEFQYLRIPRSLQQARRKGDLSFSIDRDFRAVMHACSVAQRPGQRGTWISPEFETVFSDLHDQGMAHSVEAWSADGDLAGGLYGVDAGGIFCGESMFFKKPNASKLALLFLIDHLSSCGAKWLDSQVMTPHMKALGAREIGREKFLDKLAATQDLRLDLF